MKKKSYKSADENPSDRWIAFTAPEKEVAVPEKKTSFPTANSIAKDFKTASAVARHVEKLSDEEKKSFAAKYGIPYKDASKIRGDARKKFRNS